MQIDGVFLDNSCWYVILIDEGKVMKRVVKGDGMKCKECSMEEALEFSQGRKIFRGRGGRKRPPEVWCCSVIAFVDGSAVACESQWSGPYSEVTPDIDAVPPKWWIGTLE